MNILHVIASMDPQLGGVSQAVRTIIAGLAKEGIGNEVVSVDTPDSVWSITDSFPLHYVGPGRGTWNYSSRLIPWLLDNLPRFDAVILHGLWLYNGYALGKALHHMGSQRRIEDAREGTLPRFFVMPHGMLDPYFQRAAGRRIKALRNKIYWRLIESTVIHGADAVLFTCETERLLAHVPFTPYRPRRELVIGLSVAEPPGSTTAMQEAFAKACPELQDRSYILYLSRLHEKKGVDLLIQAYQALIIHEAYAAQAAHGAGSSVLPALIIAGPGLDTPYGQRLRHMAAELPEAAIIFPGMLTGNAKWGAFYGCEAFVLPSHQENFGIAVVESLACSKPVLISNQVNIWREIETMGAGMVASDTLDGTQYLLESWLKLAESEKQAMGVRARSTYQQQFAIKTAAVKLMNALDNSIKFYAISK